MRTCIILLYMFPVQPFCWNVAILCSIEGGTYPSNQNPLFNVHSPTTIKKKILFQYLWELKIEWDDPVPQTIEDNYVDSMETGATIPDYFANPSMLLAKEFLCDVILCCSWPS